LIGNELLRDVLIHDLEFDRVKVGASMAGVQCNINLLCTKDTLSYYKSIKQGISLKQCAEELRHYDHQSNGDEDDREDDDEDPFINYMVVSCQNCDMTCALYITDKNRYYLNANMLYGQTVDDLKNSEQYSKVFGLLPQHTLEQEQNVNINIDEFPSLRKLQVHMQKALLVEKVAMEQRIAQFAAEQKQKYMQIFKRTNMERKKVFLRAQHVIKYRRPDIQTRRDNALTPQDVSTPTGGELDENILFGSQGNHSASSYLSDLRDGDQDSSGATHYEKSVDDELELPEALDDDRAGGDKSDSDDQSHRRLMRRRKKSDAKRTRELMSQSYYYRMNTNNAKGSNAAVFSLDESSENSESSDEYNSSTESESETDTEKKLEHPLPEVRKQQLHSNIASRRALHFKQKLEEKPSIYSSSVPIRVPARSMQFDLQQKQLAEQIELSEEQRSRNNNNPTADLDHGSASESSDSDSEDETPNKWPIAASLASGRSKIGQTFRRRAEDEIFEQPQGSYIERYMTFKDSFFSTRSSQQERQNVDGKDSNSNDPSSLDS